MPAMVRSIFTAALLLAASVNAHFTVQYPDTVGPFDDDGEDKGPCGGYQIDLANAKTVDFHVGGDAVATRSTHPQTNWLYRITTDATASGNWTQVYGIVQQNGIGDYCTKDLTIPPEYVGQKAVLSIVGSGTDGVLFQCSAVNFVNGTADTPQACVNGTSVTSSFTTDQTLSGMVSNSTVDNGDGDDNSGDSTPSSTPSPTNTPNAAPSLHAFTTEGFGAIFTIGAMVLAGFAFMI
ncbi:hypothetical protein HD806DRAFT_717 [Xylariaceae sp. AK1471]|nr:hypothetical protein HD806DRAFT_717 [Xylariaceae sp. AK1471]